jgi:hypothetical protein
MKSGRDPVVDWRRCGEAAWYLPAMENDEPDNDDAEGNDGERSCGWASVESPITHSEDVWPRDIPA